MRPWPLLLGGKRSGERGGDREIVGGQKEREGEGEGEGEAGSQQIDSVEPSEYAHVIIKRLLPGMRHDANRQRNEQRMEAVREGGRGGGSGTQREAFAALLLVDDAQVPLFRLWLLLLSPKLLFAPAA
jgi:hypothetical protein